MMVTLYGYFERGGDEQPRLKGFVTQLRILRGSSQSSGHVDRHMRPVPGATVPASETALDSQGKRGTEPPARPAPSPRHAGGVSPGIDAHCAAHASDPIRHSPTSIHT